MIDDILLPGEFVGIKEAAPIFRIDERTLRRWYEDEPRIGRRSLARGRIEISLPATLMYRVGRSDAIDLYCQGLRNHKAVIPFIEAFK